MVTDFNPFVAQRRKDKLELLEMVRKNKGMDERQLIALFSLRTGLRRQTVREMLDELVDAGVFDVDVKEDE